jgi:hypothetical protein
MSAISFSNNYISSAYYASAKGQRVASTETASNSNNDVASQADDVLTISAEALEALNNSGDVLTISADELEGRTKIQIEDMKRPAKVKFSTIEQLREAMKPSNRLLLRDRAFDIALKNKTYSNKTQNEQIYSRSHISLENADEIFAELLKKNNIKLNEKEHVDLTIDYNGKITVSGNISKEKSELIQNILDNDKSLGQNLLMTHNPPNLFDDTRRISVGIILQQEYGLSLEDFELNEDYEPMEYIKSKPAGYLSEEELEKYYEPYKPHERLKIKNGNDALLEELYYNDRRLFNEISELLRKQKNNPDAVIPSTTFSYQNGVFVEKGVNDAAALDSFASKAEKKLGVGRIDYSITFNNNGEITDVADDKIAANRFGKKSLKEIIAI